MKGFKKKPDLFAGDNKYLVNLANYKTNSSADKNIETISLKKDNNMNFELVQMFGLHFVELFRLRGKEERAWIGVIKKQANLG